MNLKTDQQKLPNVSNRKNIEKNISASGTWDNTKTLTFMSRAQGEKNEFNAEKKEDEEK